VFERRLYSHIDWLLLVALLWLVVIGLAMIYGTTYDAASGTVGREFFTQLTAFGLGLVALVLCLVIDYRSLTERSLLLYAVVIALLAYVLLFGEVRGGSRRWISLAPGNIQPSEFARVGVALVLAKFFAEARAGGQSMTNLIAGAGFVLIPFLLIAAEPDLGSAATLLPVLLGITFVAGMRLKWLAMVAVVALVSAPAVWTYGLQDYQRSRIATFIAPERDARGAGYQQIQARITVGSGGLTGKGYLQGTQGQYKFLPVAHNDFIYSVLAEELGFVGVLATLGLYLFVIMRSFDAATLAKDRHGTYLVMGVLGGFVFQVVYNIAMSAGLAPVKGLTLPLMSYGGSSLIATLAGFGLILNVRMRRFTN